MRNKNVLKEQVSLLVDKWSEKIKNKEIDLDDGIDVLKESIHSVFDEVWDEVIEEQYKDESENKIIKSNFSNSKIIDTIIDLLKKLKNVDQESGEMLLMEQEKIKVYVSRGNRIETYTFDSVEELDKFIKDNNLSPEQYVIQRGE